MKKKNIHQGSLLRKTRRQGKGNLFKVHDVVNTEIGDIYLLRTLGVGPTKALRRSSLSEYQLL